MYQYLHSPCLLEQYPVLQDCVLQADPFAAVQNAIRSAAVATAQKPATELRYSIDKEKNGYVLSLYKELPHRVLVERFESEISRLENELYRPQYKIVTDFFGNKYYVQQHVDQEYLRRNAASKIDALAIKRRLAKESFQDYKIDLSHDGADVIITSSRDQINNTFNFTDTLEDVNILGFQIVSGHGRMDYSVLQLALTVKQQEDALSAPKHVSDALGNLLAWSQERARLEMQKQEKDNILIQEEQNKKRKLELERERAQKRCELEEAEKKRILQEEAEIQRKLSEHIEKQRKLAIEEERQKKLQEEIIKKQKAEELEKQRQKQISEEMERQRTMAVEQEKQRQAEEHKRWQEQLARDVERQKAIQEKKKAMLEKAKNKRLSRSTTPKKTIQIDVNFNEEKTPNKRRSSSPVILEDVEDEETNKYNASLQNFHGNESIIDTI